ncbi:MAG: uracil-DNA glycosylase [Candidatus Saccharimonadales bacterium]
MPDTDNQVLLDQLKADILTKNICPELAESATQLVAGHGNPQAEVVFIGEAPGKNEDLQGIPFVGAAGKFLDQMLGEAGLVRSDIYITNIVKYRPPANRDPKPEEKRAFWPFLVRELQIIQPNITVTLGRHSMEYFLPNAKISQVHGQPKRVSFGDIKLVVLPLYHPAAALYNGDLKATLLEDFASVPTVLKLINES